MNSGAYRYSQVFLGIGAGIGSAEVDERHCISWGPVSGRVVPRDKPLRERGDEAKQPFLDEDSG